MDEQKASDTEVALLERIDTVAENSIKTRCQNDDASLGDLFQEFQRSEIEKFSAIDVFPQASVGEGKVAPDTLLTNSVSLPTQHLPKSSSPSPWTLSPKVYHRRLRPYQKPQICPERRFKSCETESSINASLSAIDLESLLLTKDIESVEVLKTALAVVTSESLVIHLKASELSLVSKGCSRDSESPPEVLEDLVDDLLIALNANVKFEQPKANIENPLLNLPVDVLINVFSFLTAKEIGQSVQFVCKEMATVTRNDSLWQIFFCRDFPNQRRTRPSDEQIPWLNLYRRRADRKTTEKYRNEPQDLRGLYLEMETALECLKKDSKDKSKDEIMARLQPNSVTKKLTEPTTVDVVPLDIDYIKDTLKHWKLSHPNAPSPMLDVVTSCKRSSSQFKFPSHNCISNKCRYEQLGKGIFICQTTGVFHLCHGKTACSRAVASEDDPGLFVCPISGRIITPQRLDWKTIKRRVRVGCHRESDGLSDIYDHVIVTNRSRNREALAQNEIDESESDQECVSVIQRIKRQQREEPIRYAEVEEGDMIEEGDWALSGYFGRCFTKGYECVTEKEYDKSNSLQEIDMETHRPSSVILNNYYSPSNCHNSINETSSATTVVMSRKRSTSCGTTSSISNNENHLRSISSIEMNSRRSSLSNDKVTHMDEMNDKNKFTVEKISSWWNWTDNHFSQDDDIDHYDRIESKELLRKEEQEKAEASDFLLISSLPLILNPPSLERVSAQHEYPSTPVSTTSSSRRPYDRVSYSLELVKDIFRLIGPGWLVAMAYIDPGNLEGDLSAGSLRSTSDPDIGYRQLWVLLWATVIGFGFQKLAIQLGATGKDLATLCRLEFPYWISIIIWIFTELCLVGADIQAVIGSAIGLKLILGIPLSIGIIVTLLDTFIVLLIDTCGTRKLEACFAFLISLMAICFFANMITSQPKVSSIIDGLIKISIPENALPFTIALIGSVIMPHNFFLQSAIVQSRSIDLFNRLGVKRISNVYIAETGILLFVSLLINIAVVVAFANPRIASPDGTPLDLYNAHTALESAIGMNSQWIWGLGLLAAGQCSTMACTYAGQFVMEGLLGLRIEKLWLRVMITRITSILPLLLLIYWSKSTVELVANWVNILQAFNLPFTLVLLLKFTSSSEVMGSLKISPVSKISAFLSGCLLVIANVNLVISQLGDSYVVVIVLLLYFTMLAYLWRRPIRNHYGRQRSLMMTNVDPRELIQNQTIPQIDNN